MKNSDVIRHVVSYITNVKQERKLSNSALAKLCQEKGSHMTDKTIGRMIHNPSSITVSTLLKVCDALELNLSSIFHAMEISKTSNEDEQGKLVSNIDHPAYKGYTGEYHVFFLPTSGDPADHQDKSLICGTLTFGDTYSCNECTAILDLDSGDLTPDGKPFKKHYIGRLIYSTTIVSLQSFNLYTLNPLLTFSRVSRALSLIGDKKYVSIYPFLSMPFGFFDILFQSSLVRSIVGSTITVASLPVNFLIISAPAFSRTETALNFDNSFV